MDLVKDVEADQLGVKISIVTVKDKLILENKLTGALVSAGTQCDEIM